MRVFMIHGMGRTPVSMWGLAVRLRWEGHQPSLFGYAVTVESLEAIAERFCRHVEKVLAADAKSAETPEAETPEAETPEYGVVGHSLGNIITRLASPHLPAGFRRFVMLAPPNHSPAMARELQSHPLFKALARDAGQRLCDDDFYESLPKPPVPSLVVAGDRGVKAKWHPLSRSANDSVVSVEETYLDGVPQVIVPGIHSFLMNRSDVFALTRRFLVDARVEVPDGARIGHL